MRNLKVALAAACAVVVGWVFTASATTIHVATYGDDGENDGSAALPYATIAKAIGLAQADDEIRVAGGVYTEALVSTVERLTISGSWTEGFAGRDLVNGLLPCGGMTNDILVRGDAERAGRPFHMNCPVRLGGCF